MELKNYLALLKNYLPLIIICSALGGIFAYFGASRLPKGFSLSQTFYVSLPASQNYQTYSFEGFYAQEKARNFTDTAVAILESADFKTQIITKNESVSARKLAPQIIRITATAQNQAETTQILDTVLTSFNRKIEALSAAPASPQLKEITESQTPVQIKLKTGVTTAAGFVLGLVFALLVISLKTYLKI